MNKTTSTSVSVSTLAYYTDVIFVVFPQTEPLIGDQPYRLAFTLQPDPTNEWNVTGSVSTIPVRVDALVGTNITTLNRYGGANWINFVDTQTCSRECSAKTVKNVFNAALGTAARTFNVDFYSSGGKPIHNVSVVIRLHATWTVKGKRNNTYTITNLSLTRKSYNRTLGTPLTKPSSFISALTEMPPLPASSFTERTDCPQDQAGLKRWQEPATWGGTVPPVNGTPITLPANSKVYIDGCTFSSQTWSSPLGTITIPEGSELIIGEGVSKLTITNILVKGRLRIGGPTCRLKTQMTITVSSTAAKIDDVCGARTICATGKGQIDIHGKLFDATWSRLASHAFAGDDRVQLQSTVNWEVGQSVVITSTSFNNSADNHQYEVRVIKAVQGKLVQFTQPLEYYHYAGAEYQGEVALLSRRITIQGDAASANSKIGGHIIGVGATAQLRVSGVLAFRMGQYNTMARYPFHFHHMKSAPHSYFRDCSVWNSFFRCYTVHGTNDTVLSRNVAFNTIGHCYYIEDGVEENNKFQYNLAAYQVPIWATPGVPTNFAPPGSQSQEGLQLDQNSNIVIPADVSAGAFYITNAYNEFVGNVGSGGFAGFSFVNLLAPIGTHRDQPGIVPKDRMTKVFDGNSCHSAGWHWTFTGCVYIGGQLWYQNTSTSVLTYRVGRFVGNTRRTAYHNGTQGWMRFTNLQVAQCRMGLSHWGDRLELINFQATDVARSAQIFGESWMDNAVVNVNSTNPVPKAADVITSTTEGFQYYDTNSRAIITRVQFKNFLRSKDWTISALTHSDQFKPQGIAASKAITFSNCNDTRRIWLAPRDPFTGSVRYFNLMDFDGSIMNTSGRTLIGNAQTEYRIYNDSGSGLISNWWKIHSSCIQNNNWKVWGCTLNDWRYQVASISLYVKGLIEKDVVINDYTDYAGLMTHFGGGGRTIVTRNVGITGPTGPGLGWFLTLNKGTPNIFNVSIYNIPWVPELGSYTYLPLVVPYPKSLSSSHFTIVSGWIYTAKKNNVTAAANLTEMYQDPLGRKFYYDAGTGYLYLKIVGEWPANHVLTDKSYSAGGCRLYDSNSHRYDITFDCPSCTPILDSGGTKYYTPGTTTPPPVANAHW